MKVTIFSSTLLLGLLLYSCAKTEDINEDHGDNTAPITIIEFKTTQTDWASGDKIGLFMVRESASGIWETVVDDASNRCYQLSDDGIFSPATDADAIKTPLDGKSVNFVAYYPYDAELAHAIPCLYALDMSNQTDVEKTNFMVSRNLEGVTPDGNPLSLDFHNPLSRVSINISSDFEPSQLDGLTVKIHGIKYQKADYVLLCKGDKLSNFIEQQAPTIAVVSADGMLAEAFLLAEPNTLASDGSFVFELKDGRSITYELTDAVSLEAGQNYIYNIHLKDDSATEEYFEVLPEQIAGVEVEGGAHKLSLISKSSWTVKSKPDWVICTPVSGRGGSAPREITVSVGVNNSNNLLREGQIVFEDANGEQKQIEISQKGYVPIGYEANMRYRIDNQELPEIVTYPARDIVAEDLRWRYYTSSFWNAKLLLESSQWISFSYETPRLGYLRPGEQAIFSIANNNSSEPREISVKMVAYDSTLIRVYRVVQQGATDYLEVDKTKFNSRGKGDNFDFVVSSRNEWQAESVPSWITLTRGATSSNKTPVNIVCALNQGAARSAKIIIRSGAMTQTVEVSQNAKKVQSYPYRLPYYAIVHAFAGADFKFVGASQGTNNYANTADIVVRPGDGTSSEFTKAYGPYGFVVNPPTATEFKSAEIYGQTMVVSNYVGSITSIRELEVSINYNGWTYIRRANIYNLPVPAGLTDEDKLVYTIKMTNVKWSGEFNYSISYEIK